MTICDSFLPPILLRCSALKGPSLPCPISSRPALGPSHLLWRLTSGFLRLRSALAAFLRPEARLYRPRASGFGTARSGSSSPVARGGGGRRPAISGQVFAGVPAFAAPFSGRDGTALSPRCGYASSGIDSLHSPSARSSRYERLLMLQEATAGARPQCEEGSTAGAPGPEFMRRNAVLLKKRQAWAATKRRVGGVSRIRSSCMWLTAKWYTFRPLSTVTSRVSVAVLGDWRTHRFGKQP